MEPATDERVKKGKEFMEFLWWSYAKRIVRLAGEHYNWTDEQWGEASELFLKPTDYSVVVIH
jgi:hypothetical protein